MNVCAALLKTLNDGFNFMILKRKLFIASGDGAGGDYDAAAQ